MGGWGYHSNINVFCNTTWGVSGFLISGTAENIGMKIQVLFITGQVGHINIHTLDYMIRQKEIVAFRRFNGWVHLGRDPIRSVHHPFERSYNRLGDFES
jgi:hypothetical protein